MATTSRTADEAMKRWVEGDTTVAVPSVYATGLTTDPVTGGIATSLPAWSTLRLLDSGRIKGKSAGGVAAGQLATLTTAGTGYNNGTAGTFYGVELTGGGGTGAKATVVLTTSGVPTHVTVTHSGTGYTSSPTAIVANTGYDISGTIMHATGGTGNAIVCTLDTAGTEAAPGILGKIAVNVVDSGSTILVYDGYDASVAANLKLTLSAATATIFDLNMKFLTGCFLLVREHAPGTTPDLTVFYL